MLLLFLFIDKNKVKKYIKQVRTQLRMPTEFAAPTLDVAKLPKVDWFLEIIIN